MKTPRLYFVDTGVLCHLLGIETERQLETSPFLGEVFETFVASEIAKAQLAAGRRRELYFFRDEQGLEVDFVVPVAGGRLLLAEAKASRTPTPAMAVPMQRLLAAIGEHASAAVVHRRDGRSLRTPALAPGVSRWTCRVCSRRSHRGPDEGRARDDGRSPEGRRNPTRWRLRRSHQSTTIGFCTGW